MEHFKDYKIPDILCVNCDQKIDWHSRKQKIYCSDLCKQEVKFIRYARKCKSEKKDQAPEIKEALKIRLAHILGGGYAESERRIPEKLRKEVIRKYKGKCAICSKVGDDIDHIDGDSNQIDNLQLLCKICHLIKTQTKLNEITPSHPKYAEYEDKIKHINLRIESQIPFKLCDDKNTWDSRKYEEKNKKIFYDSLKPFIEKLKEMDVSMREIARIMNSENIPTYSGVGNWESKGVKKVLVM